MEGLEERDKEEELGRSGEEGWNSIWLMVENMCEGVRKRRRGVTRESEKEKSQRRQGQTLRLKRIAASHRLQERS